jgi:sulfite exporter TauE/SafE/copper chaperone CopZ
MKIDSKIIPIKGMHCKSCTIIVAEELNKIPGVKHTCVSLKTNSATISFNDEPTELQIDQAIDRAGYIVGNDEKPMFSKDKSTYGQFFLSLAWIAIIFLVLKVLGFSGINFSGLGDNKGLMALVVGITAGFSTCMALVGGLILGLSARYAEKHQSATVSQRFKPHLFFNLGRIVTFFILGGVVGLFGSFFRLNSSITGLLTIGIGFVMLILGAQLTEIFPRLSNKGLTLPAGLAKFIGINQKKDKEYSHKNAIVLGGLTFFLPCGFTQAMQLVAIGSGSFVTGSIVMGLFAIGTAPGLLGVGGLTSVVKGKFAKVFFRFAGALVVLLSIYNISNGLNLTGYKFSLDSGQSSGSVSAPIDKNVIILKTIFTPSQGTQDISPNTFNVEVGKSYMLSIEAKGDGQGCMSTIMIPGVYDTPMLITKGMLTLPFKIDKAGSYNITCAMGIVRGSIIATDGSTK